MLQISSDHELAHADTLYRLYPTDFLCTNIYICVYFAPYVLLILLTESSSLNFGKGGGGLNGGTGNWIINSLYMFLS